MTVKVKRCDERFFQAISRLANSRVLVGVPEANAERHEKGTGPGNAALAYIHERGDPEHGIPARPFLAPGAAAAKPQVAAGLKRAAQLALSGKSPERGLAVAGSQAVSSVKKVFAHNSWSEVSDAGVASRIRRKEKLKGKKIKRRRPGKFKKLVDKYPRPVKPLVDSGQLRNSITYVIEEEGRRVTS